MLALRHLLQGCHKISFLRLFRCFRLHPQPGRIVTLMNDFLYQTRHLISCLEKFELASTLSLEAKKKYTVMHQIKAILNSDCDVLEKISCIDLTAVWPLTHGCSIKFPHFKMIKSIFQDLWTWGLRHIKQFNWKAVCILKNNKSMTFDRNFEIDFLADIIITLL